MHIKYSHVICHLCDHHLLSTNQHNFRKGFSCATQLFFFNLLLICTTISMLLKLLMPFSLILLKPSIPYHTNSFSITLLIIHSDIIERVANFLINSKQAAYVGERNSPKLPSKSGVPQGCVPGQLLFLNYNDDLSLNLSSHIRLFQDYYVVYRRITNPDDQALLQHDLDTISLWCNKWQLNINTNKSIYV